MVIKMDSKVIVIFGSSRSDGDTMKIVEELFKDKEVEIIDLVKQNISYFDYEHKNIDDDFLNIIDKLIKSKIIVFATPVYWYSMSAVMKTFFDRLSDLVQVRKEMGRKLKGKKIYLIANGGGGDMPDFFHKPFSLTADYLDMEFKGYFYHSGRGKFNEEYREEGNKFVDGIYKELE